MFAQKHDVILMSIKPDARQNWAEWQVGPSKLIHYGSYNSKLIAFLNLQETKIQHTNNRKGIQSFVLIIRRKYSDKFGQKQYSWRDASWSGRR